jgi:hypothetical protein
MCGDHTLLNAQSNVQYATAFDKRQTRPKKRGYSAPIAVGTGTIEERISAETATDFNSTQFESSFMYSAVTVSETRNLLRRFQIENLKARLVLCEIAETGFTNEIRSLHTTPEQLIDAIRCRRQILLDRKSVLGQLTALNWPLRGSPLGTSLAAQPKEPQFQ